MKLSSLLALLSVTSASAFVAPRSFPTQAAPRTILSASPNDDQYQHRISRAATAAVATIAATLASSPLAALATEEADGYEYGAVNAPGGIGECVLGVMVVARFDGYCDFSSMGVEAFDRWRMAILPFSIPRIFRCPHPDIHRNAAIFANTKNWCLSSCLSRRSGLAGLAVGLGVLAILTAAVPVILAPGEDAFNAMKEKDGDFGRDMAPPTKKFGKK